jgi:phage baseplate assembly protein W
MAYKYKGFSTIGRFKKFRLTDIDLVKQDLLNHFSIRKGEKLMNPNFGSIIWSMIYEPLTEESKSLIIDDVSKVVSYDPRLRVDNVIIDELDVGVQIQVELTFLPGNYSSSLTLEFNGASNQLTVS